MPEILEASHVDRERSLEQISLEEKQDSSLSEEQNNERSPKAIKQTSFNQQD